MTAKIIHLKTARAAREKETPPPEFAWACECGSQTFTLWAGGDVHCAECLKLNWHLRFHPEEVIAYR